MLEYLEIENYQSHVHSRINFSPRITGIIGESMSGKTAIIRALRWLLRNRPLGFRFNTRSNNDTTTTTRVTVKIDDHKIIAEKTTKEHMYHISGYGSRRKFSQQVPQEITDIFNVDEDINFQYQLDSPFLIIGRPGEIASAITRATQTGILDSAMKRINKRTASLIAKREVLYENIEEAKQELEKIACVCDKVEPLVLRMKRTYKRIDTRRKQLDQITSLAKVINKIKQRLKLAEKSDSIKQLIHKHEEGHANIKEKQNTIRLIDNALRLRGAINRQLRQKEEIAERYMAQIRSMKQCPTCLSPLDEDNIRRIEDEIYPA